MSAPPHTRWIVAAAASQLALGVLLAFAGEVRAARIWLLLGPLLGALVGKALALFIAAQRTLREARSELKREGFRIAYDPTADAPPVAADPRRVTGARRARRDGASIVTQGSDASA